MKETCDHAIRGFRYRIELIPLIDACRIKNMLVSQAIKHAQVNRQAAAESAASAQPSNGAGGPKTAEEAKGDAQWLWLTYGPDLPEADYRKIQLQMLRSCSQYVEAEGTDESERLPVLMANGKIAAAGLSSDPAALDELIREAVGFNLGPFFADEAGKK